MTALARPAKIETQVRTMMNEAQKRLFLTHNRYLPEPRRSFTYHPEHTGETVTLHGESLGHGPIAEYRTKDGIWQANMSLRGAGKPWKVA